MDSGSSGEAVDDAEPTSTTADDDDDSDGGSTDTVGVAPDETTGEMSTGGSDGWAGESTSTDAGEAEDSSGEPPILPDPQPQSGQYSHCSEGASDCGNGLACLMVTIGGTLDGYCSVDNCEDPGADCDPAPPGATATPACGTLSNGASYCLLDCAVGTCPDGMICHTSNWDGEILSACT